MIKNFVIGLLLVPYLFLATSVTDGAESVKGGENCVVSRMGSYSAPVGFVKSYYSGFGMFKNEYIILPKFNIKEEVFFAQCPIAGELMIGATDFIKVNEKIHVYWRVQELRLFGLKFAEEKGIFMFGTGWRKQ